MSRKMYSPELKLEIIKRHLKDGESVTLLAHEYHIGSRADIRKWISQYKEHGVTRLSTTHGDSVTLLGGFLKKIGNICFYAMM